METEGIIVEEIVREVRWRKADVAPSNIYAPIVYCTTNGKLGVFKNTMGYIWGNPEPYSKWDWIVDKYSIKYWAYSNEIIPVP